MAGEQSPPNQAEVDANIGAIPRVGKVPVLGLEAANAASIFLKENNPELFRLFQDAKAGALETYTTALIQELENPATSDATKEMRMRGFVAVIGNIVGFTLLNGVGQANRDTEFLRKMFEGDTMHLSSKTDVPHDGDAGLPPAA